MGIFCVFLRFEHPCNRCICLSKGVKLFQLPHILLLQEIQETKQQV